MCVAKPVLALEGQRSCEHFTATAFPVPFAISQVQLANPPLLQAAQSLRFGAGVYSHAVAFTRNAVESTNLQSDALRHEEQLNICQFGSHQTENP